MTVGGCVAGFLRGSFQRFAVAVDFGQRQHRVVERVRGVRQTGRDHRLQAQQLGIQIPQQRTGFRVVGGMAKQDLNRSGGDVDDAAGNRDRVNGAHRG